MYAASLLLRFGQRVTHRGRDPRVSVGDDELDAVKPASDELLQERVPTSYSYDANGNRLTKTEGAATTFYVYDDHVLRLRRPGSAGLRAGARGARLRGGC
ncbi:MAG: hypothetical protein H0U99_07085, partial [Chthoniobacterales bacterium]|nr:hypothetical protein [Chthoniobacterales bacterium]